MSMRTALLALALLGPLLPAALAAAQPVVDQANAVVDEAGAVIDHAAEIIEPARPTAASYRDDRPLAASYLEPALEVVTANLVLNATARAAGAPWAVISPSTMVRNLTSAWVYDEDMFAINQFGHPYQGSVAFAAARSSGLGFWTAAAYTFASSLLWETLLENEPSSINDQLTTTIGGTLLGEALHRWSRAVLTGGGEHPSLGRRILSTIIAPIETGNRHLLGDRWRRVPPPLTHASVAVGWHRELSGGTRSLVHVELAVAHGLPSDPRFVPRVPLDSFDLRAQFDAATDELVGYIDVRGLVVGRVFGPPRRRALWGLYGAYDYWNPVYARGSAVGVGPGITAHLALGPRGFVEAVAIATVVPMGAAGGAGDGAGPQHDYHRGPGLGQFVEVKLGKRDLGFLRLNARALEIDGTLIDDATEAVVLTTIAGTVELSPHHALGAEVVYAARSARFAGAQATAFDQAAQLRLTYTVISDGGFGGGFASRRR